MKSKADGEGVEKLAFLAMCVAIHFIVMREEVCGNTETETICIISICVNCVPRYLFISTASVENLVGVHQP